MAGTQAEFDALQKAIRQGALRVRYSDPGGNVKDVTYRNLDEMQQALRQLEQELGTRTQAARTFRYVNTCKGIE